MEGFFDRVPAMDSFIRGLGQAPRAVVAAAVFQEKQPEA